MSKKVILASILLFFSLSILAKPPKKIRFAFMTDIHLNKENTKDRYNGLLQSLEAVKKQKVDFIIIGGDVVDVTGMGSTSKAQADSMYTVYKQTFDKINIPYYPTIGNHDRYFDKENGLVDGDEIFKSHFNESYYTFEKKGIYFFILNSVKPSSKSGYNINEEQLEWLKAELAKVPKLAPIIVSTHVPVYSYYYPVVEGKYEFRDVVANYKDLLKTFEGHNLKLVMQGHQHIHEEMLLQDVQYITGGAVCADWWGGAFHGTEEGFPIVEVDKKDNFTWEYIDYGWTAKK